MKFAQKQQGKGLITFLAGSVAALVAIAVMLFMLNNNSSKVFKQPELVNDRPTQPEVLHPDMSSQPQSAAVSQPAALPVQVSQVAAAPVKPVAASQPAALAGTDNAISASQPKLSDTAHEDKPVVAAKQPKPQEAKPKETVKAEPALTEEELKPTAQQILDSGNIEKAREVAKQEALAKRAEAQKAEKAKRQAEAKTAKAQSDTAAKPKKGGSANVQAGAFGNRDAAEAQRAKLALMGVKTQVVTVESGGKKVYRVQTGTISAEKAREVQNNLKEQGVNTYTRAQ